MPQTWQMLDKNLHVGTVIWFLSSLSQLRNISQVKVKGFVFAFMRKLHFSRYLTWVCGKHFTQS